MLSACDSSSTPVDYRVTARYYRSTQVHPGPQGSPIPLALPKGIEKHCGLQQLTEATVSSIKRELTRRASQGGASAIDVVEPASAVN